MPAKPRTSVNSSAESLFKVEDGSTINMDEESKDNIQKRLTLKRSASKANLETGVSEAKFRKKKRKTRRLELIEKRYEDKYEHRFAKGFYIPNKPFPLETDEHHFRSPFPLPPTYPQSIPTLTFSPSFIESNTGKSRDKNCVLTPKTGLYNRDMSHILKDLPPFIALRINNPYSCLDWLKKTEKGEYSSHNAKSIIHLDISTETPEPQLRPPFYPTAQHWCNLFDKLHQDATNIESLTVFWSARLGKDMAFLRALIKLKVQKSIFIGGRYGKHWKRFMQDKMGVEPVDLTEMIQEGWREEVLLEYQKGTEDLLPWVGESSSSTQNLTICTKTNANKPSISTQNLSIRTKTNAGNASE